MSKLAIKEIRKNLSKFSKDWELASSERGQSQVFWLRFYECFGIRAESVTIYEKAVSKIKGNTGFIDSFIPGKLIVEHKSLGKSLEAAFDQASDYFLALDEQERPQYIITCDFAKFRVYDLKNDTKAECSLQDISKHAEWFLFLTDDTKKRPLRAKELYPADRHAADGMGELHESLLEAKFTGKDLETFLTRLLFCFFADSTGIFGYNGMFRKLVESTAVDGKDLGGGLQELFDVLDTPEQNRQKYLNESLAEFAYINGKLFSDRTKIPAFNQAMRQNLINCAQIDWGKISPDIFGSLFQNVMHYEDDSTRQKIQLERKKDRTVIEEEVDEDLFGEHKQTKITQIKGKSDQIIRRRALGAHYTSENNILRVINPLFMDDLRAELNLAKKNTAKLQAIYDKLPTLTFLDPACGCGNFLVVAYRELRRLEMDVITRLFEMDPDRRGVLDVSDLCCVRVNQFYGIEIDEPAVHIARVALWITDHQMNLEAAERFGNTRPSVPLVDSPHIHHANALQIDWNEVLPAAKCCFVMGNPPFLGKQQQSPDQKRDLEALFKGQKNTGVLDFVCGWYVKSLPYLKANPQIDVAFVSTNSITQGEQVAALWPTLFSSGIRIHFAHRTFKWSNEGKGVAAVHCVIIGFGLQEKPVCRLFDYAEDIAGEPSEISAKQINPYLVDAPAIILENRKKAISWCPEITYGSFALDDGNYTLTEQEKNVFIQSDPKQAEVLRPFIGAREFLHSESRYAIWLKDINPSVISEMKDVMNRVKNVKKWRLASNRKNTFDLGSTPTIFAEIRQPEGGYLALPTVSSERRNYLPIGMLTSSTIASNQLYVVPNAGIYDFAILNSTMHNAWIRAVCGRIKSDYRYSASIVYNNYPWPTPTQKQREAIEKAGQQILDVRKKFSNSSLADLYDPLTMPPDLVKAHQVNDRVIDAAYGYSNGKEDAKRVAFLFSLYQQLTSLLN